MILEYRLMLERDLAQVLAIERESYSHPWSEQSFVGCLDGADECWVLLVDGEIVGHLVLKVILDEGQILNICVRPALQGQGVGAQLMAFAEDRFIARKVSTVFLEVRSSNTPARRLYDAAGYAEIGRRNGYYPSAGGREDAIIMGLQLEIDGG
ncbi:ribosomal protein S18-alanine N-acetyltransferase [Allohahella marinimesophila]|uniref:[Ribosomal protein bS18]-alanine N-acetyltransferase n=1 Tax=Allohahella marinimesophila TaxID=1054972 RepID=A0ABP7NES5_9GAMM